MISFIINNFWVIFVLFSALLHNPGSATAPCDRNRGEDPTRTVPGEFWSKPKKSVSFLAEVEVIPEVSEVPEAEALCNSHVAQSVHTTFKMDCDTHSLQESEFHEKESKLVSVTPLPKAATHRKRKTNSANSARARGHNKGIKLTTISYRWCDETCKGSYSRVVGDYIDNHVCGRTGAPIESRRDMTIRVHAVESSNVTENNTKINKPLSKTKENSTGAHGLDAQKFTLPIVPPHCVQMRLPQRE